MFNLLVGYTLQLPNQPFSQNWQFRGIPLNTTTEKYGKKPGISGTINRLHAHIQRTPTRIKPEFYYLLHYLHLLGYQ
jgi:hypothetical protein